MKHHNPRAALCCTAGNRRTTGPGVCHRAFARVEAIALVFLTFLLIALIAATAPYERRTAMLNRDLANLRQIGAWTFAYANDFEGLHPSFSSVPNSIYLDLRATATGTPLVQAAGHAIDIIRRRTGRNAFPLPRSWLPHPLYTHLVLADYANRLLPDPSFVSTGDKHRLNWLDDPINKHDQGFWQPFQNPQGGKGPVPQSQKRWPYSASFQTPPAWYDKSQVGSRISQPSPHQAYSVPPSGVLGGQPLPDVTFPSQKVMVHDYGAWHFSRRAQYFAVETSRVLMLMGDGSASARQTADANEGWIPNSPTGPSPTTLSFSPRSWEPPAIDPSGIDPVIAHYRWTRGGIEGRDFDGPEIDTGQY